MKQTLFLTSRQQIQVLMKRRKTRFTEGTNQLLCLLRGEKQKEKMKGVEVDEAADDATFEICAMKHNFDYQVNKSDRQL
ncbi:hypothetical protein F2Q70_00020999 [Brassica cretica]|nr:hypothetical protein F2Q70_00020999 [Brassica cretica]KAF2577676.1 hypothetical protein F2Q68_00004686 [Brassica cretica]